jgi:hypothetical protein
VISKALMDRGRAKAPGRLFIVVFPGLRTAIKAIALGVAAPAVFLDIGFLRIYFLCTNSFLGQIKMNHAQNNNPCHVLGASAKVVGFTPPPCR